MAEALTLAGLQAKRTLKPIQATYVALGTIQALERAHAQGQVRGHLTPQDIQLTDPVSLTRTPAPPDAAYETPDHLYGDPITPRTDLYAFGLLLYELLTQRPPFVTPNDEALRQRQMEAPVPDPRLHKPDLDLDLLILLLSLLDKEPFFRPASAAEVRQRLTAILQPDAASTPSEPDDLIGQLLSRCQVRSFIGEGRLAWVFLAHDILDEQPVAVKVFKPTVVRDPVPLTRFQDDMPKLFELKSPRVTQLLGAGVFAGLPYLLFPYVRGRSLRDLMDTSVQEGIPFSRHEVTTFVKQTAQALTLAHEHGLAHGDVNPGNIIISAQDGIVLTDLGLAAIHPVESAHPALTGVRQIQGTPTYMAPEQIRDGAVTPATDVYALGVVIYELLTGRPPFKGERAEVLVQHLEASPPAAQDYRPGLPDQVDMVLWHALAKDPADRFETPTALASALENAWDIPLPPPPKPPPEPPKPSRISRLLQDPDTRQRLNMWALVGIISLFGCCLIGGIGILLVSVSPTGVPGLGQPSATPTVTATPTPTPTSTPVPASARVYRARIISIDAFPGCAIRGRVVNASGRGEADAWMELYNANKQWLLNIPTGPDGWYEFTTSPGGYYMKIKNRNSVWSPLINLKFEQLAVVNWYAQ